MQRDLRGGAAERIEAGLTGAGEGVDDAVGSDLADDVVIGVGDEDIARAVESQTLRAIELRLRGRAAVAAKTRTRIPGDHGDGAGRIEPEDRVQAGEVEISGAIGGNALRRANGND